MKNLGKGTMSDQTSELESEEEEEESSSEDMS